MDLLEIHRDMLKDLQRLDSGLKPRCSVHLPCLAELLDAAQRTLYKIAHFVHLYVKFVLTKGYTDIGPTDIGPTDIGPTDIGPNDIGPTGHWSDKT